MPAPKACVGEHVGLMQQVLASVGTGTSTGKVRPRLLRFVAKEANGGCALGAGLWLALNRLVFALERTALRAEWQHAASS